MKKIILGIASLLLSSQAWSYVTATYGTQSVNSNTRTHIIIAGKGNELGTLFQTSSAAKAKKYADLYPNEQVYFIGVNETGKPENLELLAKYGFKNITEKKTFNFESSDVLSEMRQFKRIASVDIYSHAVAYYGVILDGATNRMDPKKDGYDTIASNFTSDAFAFLHGCNSGQFLAPILSLQWGIPVAGSFGSTDFAKLHEDRNWYYDDGRRPKEGNFESVNRVTYQRNELCIEGACRRLSPSNFPYNGYWGDFAEGGLGFYKFFCMKNTTEVCQKAMARAALTYVSVKPLTLNSSLEDFKAVVFDTLCPLSSKPEVRAKCKTGLENAAATGGTYDSFDGKSLQCDFKGCMAQFKCKRIPIIDLLKEGSCTVENKRPSAKTTTQVEEYKAYIKGWQLLHATK
jgi:hypothetical protein